MIWNNHSEDTDDHAFLSPSNYHWINYDIPKLINVFKNDYAKKEGVIMHEFAATAIEKKYKLAKSKKTLNLYINDCIGFNMRPEQRLFYSFNAFGTTDAISFKDNILRIFDLKTGVVRASFKQLEVYAALFCLEYTIDPKNISIHLRIYQNNEYLEHYPESDHIQSIMDRIVEFDQVIEDLKKELN